MIYTVLAFLIIFIISFVFSSSAQGISGKWKANDAHWNGKTHIGNGGKADKEDPLDNESPEPADKDSIQLNFSYKYKNGQSNHGNRYKFSEINGLTKEQANGSNVSVRFKLEREAGVIDCEGTFNNGKGSGNFTFTANPDFAAAMKRRGFDFEEHKLFSAASLDLTVAVVDDIVSAGFKNLDTEDLFKAKIFKVNSAFMKEMASIGFKDLDMEDLVKARIFKVDAKFAKEVLEMGFANDSMEDLVKLRIFKITPEYLREMKNIGFTGLSIEDAVKLRIFKVTPEFIKEMNAAGLNNLSGEDAVKLRIFKVDGDFISRARAKGYTGLDVEGLVNLRIFNKVK